MKKEGRSDFTKRFMLQMLHVNIFIGLKPGSELSVTCWLKWTSNAYIKKVRARFQ